MRLLILVPTRTSFDAFLRELAAEASEQGHTVRVVHGAASLQQPGSTQTPDTRVDASVLFPRGMNPWGHLRAAGQLRRVVDEFQPDVLSVHFSAAAFTCAIARKSSWPPLVATIQGVIFPQQTGLRRTLLEHAELWAYRRMDEVWVLTRDDHAALLARGLGKRVHLQQTPGFGCRLDEFDRSRLSPAAVASARAAMGVRNGELVIAFVGRQVAFKGFGLAVRAFLQFHQAYPNSRLVLVGGRDHLHDQGLSPAEAEEIRRIDAIKDLGWREDVAAVLANTDLVLFPSLREGMPVNLMEALTMGVPCVTYRSRGCQDIVRNGVDGIVVPEWTPEAFASALLDLARFPSERKRLSDQARSGGYRFDRRGFVAEHLEALERVSTRGRTSPAARLFG